MRLFDENMDLDEMEGRPLIEKILLVSGKMLIVIGIGLMLFLEDSIIPYIVIMLGILCALTFNMLIKRKDQDGGKIKWDKEIIGKLIGRAIMFGVIILAVVIDRIALSATLFLAGGAIGIIIEIVNARGIEDADERKNAYILNIGLLLVGIIVVAFLWAKGW